MITQKRCIAIFYEGSKLQSPKDKNSSWMIQSGSFRWICPEERLEKINYKDSPIEVQNGEFLVHNNRLVVHKDTVKAGQRKLKLETLYGLKNKKWLELKNQPEPFDLWKQLDRYPAPKESFKHKMEKPNDPYVTRFFINGVPFGLSGIYNHEWHNKTSEYDMDTHGIRFGVNFPWKNKSIFVFLEAIDLESRKQQKGHMLVGDKSIRSETQTLGVGLRNSHTKGSSYYSYLGFTRQTMRFDFRPDVVSFYDAKILYPYGLSVGGGYQKIFWPKNWISLVLGIDLKITQTLSQGKVYYFHQPWPEVNDPRGSLTEFTSFLYFGPVFNF